MGGKLPLEAKGAGVLDHHFVYAMVNGPGYRCHLRFIGALKLRITAAKDGTSIGLDCA
jgi:hypothetical protein